MRDTVRQLDEMQSLRQVFILRSQLCFYIQLAKVSFIVNALNVAILLLLLGPTLVDGPGAMSRSRLRSGAVSVMGNNRLRCTSAPR